eukprot:m.219530 g.219530  ORF g.219530 m.219530 type:complete len:377 (-) comp33294_c0_seq2:288-1418(-)
MDPNGNSTDLNEWWIGPDPEKVTVLVLGTISFFIWILHARWVIVCYKRLYSLKNSTLGVVSAVGVYAVANMCVDLVRDDAKHLFEDIEVLCKVFYCYFITQHTLSLFKISGWGSEDESIEAMVALLNENELTTQEFKNPIGFCIFWGCAGRKFKPTKGWITACVRRIQGGIFVIFFEGFIIRRVLENYDLDGDGFAGLDWKKGGFWIDLIEVVATITTVSGTLPLARFYNKVVAPTHAGNNGGVFRMNIFVFFFGWITVFQDMLIGVVSLGEYKYHKPTIVAIEMIIVQLMVHKGFIGPPFIWNPFRPYIDPSRENVLALLPTALLGASSVQGQDSEVVIIADADNNSENSKSASGLGSNDALDSTPLLRASKLDG